MPIHDWTRVDAGIFHDFHLSWVVAIHRVLNTGLLPSACYALIEGLDSELQPLPDVLAEEASSLEPPYPTVRDVRTDPPPVRFTMWDEAGAYARKQRTVAIRHSDGHQLLALIEVLSPGTKSARMHWRAWLRRMVAALRQGAHLLVLDLHPPGPNDPLGPHGALWSELNDDHSLLLCDKPLTLAAYSSGLVKTAYIEPIAVGDVLPDLPLFLTVDRYINLPTEATYQKAWESLPRHLRQVLEAPGA